jgi:hypothetical protein
MLKPTKKNQEKWIKDHLNSGVCPRHWYDYTAPSGQACYSALNWLSQQDHIHTLAQAWLHIPRPDWLLWALSYMSPRKADLDKLCAIVKRMHRSHRATLLSVPEWGSISSKFEGFAATLPWHASPTERDFLLTEIRKAWPNPWESE